MAELIQSPGDSSEKEMEKRLSKLVFDMITNVLTIVMGFILLSTSGVFGAWWISAVLAIVIIWAGAWKLSIEWRRYIACVTLYKEYIITSAKIKTEEKKQNKEILKG